MKLYLVRHGQSTVNISGEVYQGQLDSDLSDLGLKQAEAIGERLKEYKFDILYTSDLQRARKTADAISKYHKNTKIIVDKRLRERSHGELEGKPKDDFYTSKEINQIYVKPPLGEDYLDIKIRVEEFLKEIIESKFENILIVSHGGTMRTILHILFDIDPEIAWSKQTPVSNTAFFILEIKDDERKIVLQNCTEHLKYLEELKEAK